MHVCSEVGEVAKFALLLQHEGSPSQPSFLSCAVAGVVLLSATIEVAGSWSPADWLVSVEN